VVYDNPLEAFFPVLLILLGFALVVLTTRLT